MENRDLHKKQTFGMVFNIQRYSLHDGPGIRTLIFLKGCALRCKWCSNPEAQRMEQYVLEMEGKNVLVGRLMTPQEVMNVVVQDAVFYRRSGGGITLSGGEPLLQPAFAEELFRLAKMHGYTTAVETAGFVRYQSFERVLPYLDLILIDIKLLNPEKHKMWTGQTNEMILENIARLSRTGKQMIVRVPVIPTVNDNIEEIRQIARFTRNLETVREIHLLPYHRLGEGKYQKVGKEYEMRGILPPSQDQMKALLDVVLEEGLMGQIGG